MLTLTAQLGKMKSFGFWTLEWKIPLLFFTYLDGTLVSQPSNIPGLAGKLSLPSLGHLELSGGGENCR